MKYGRFRWIIVSNLMGNCFSSGYEQSLHKDHHHFSSKKSQGGFGTEVKSNEPSTKLSRPDSLEIRSIRTPSNPKSVTDLRRSPGYSHADIFTYEEMTVATKQFRPDYILGEGGFGVVYKGVIDDSIRPGYKTTNVAVKELNPDGVQGDREWLAEINYLGQLSHPNLVKLVGYCCEDEHRLLVYEYMASGSLEKHLFRRVGSTLTWPKRMKIALDAAKGLAFLHGAERSVIYRDFKTSNILLDANFNAKLSDFGLAKDGPMGDQTHVSTRVMGTYGYAAPEYVMTGHLTARSDVYGFGVVLLELLIGQRALDKSRPSSEHNLVEWARPILNQNKKVLRILDPRLDGQYAVKTAVKVSYLAYQCLSQNPKGRPLMNEVVALLETVQTEVDEASIQNSGAGTTLYEDPSRSPYTPDTRRHARRNSSNHEGDAGRSRAARSRSGSAPPTETDPCTPTIDTATPTRK